MLICKKGINKDTVLLRFKCPNCGAKDAVHIYMPDYCFKCGKAYVYNAESLYKEQYERIHYHFNKRTTDYYGEYYNEVEEDEKIEYYNRGV